MQPRPTHLGPYELVEALGQGAMGAVYKGRHTQLGAVRAVKVLLGQETPARVERFLRETRHLAQIRHPNVVSVHDVGQAETGHLFYAMDMVEGEDLEHVLARGQLSYERGLALVIGLCKGVAALHAAGILHRDLKPANVVVRPNGEPVVLDLGLAVAPELDERITKTGALLGTPFYMAPEQAVGRKASAQSDVYALGLIAHEVLSGYRIAESGQLPGFVSVPAPSSVESNLPRAFDALCAKALQPEPEDRYASAAELVQALEALRDAPGLTRRTIRRAQLGVAFAIALVGVGLALAFKPQVQAKSNAVAAPEAVAPPVDEQALADAEREATRELRRAVRISALPARQAALAAWLDDHPKHSRVSAARAYLADARLRVPLRAWKLKTPAGDAGAFLGDGSVLTVSGGDPLTRWSAETGEALSRWSHLGGLRELAVSSAGDRLAAASRRGGITLLTFGPPERVEQVGSGLVFGLAFSPGDRFLAYAIPRKVYLVDLAGDRSPRLLATLRVSEEEGVVNALAFSSDGKTLAVGGDKAVGVLVFSLPEGRLIYESAQLSKCQDLTFLPDGQHFVIARGGGTLGVQSLDSPRQVGLFGETAIVGTAQRSIRAVCVTPDGRFLHSLERRDRGVADGPGLRRIWDVATREELGTIDHVSADGGSMEISVDGTRLLTVSAGRVELWEVGVPPVLPSLD